VFKTSLTDLALSAHLDELPKHYPQVRLKISADWTTHLVRELRSGALDCAVALLSDETRLPRAVASTALGSEELVVVAAKLLPLPDTRRILQLRNIASNAWILNPPGSGYRATVQHAFDPVGLALVARGAGLTVAPRNKFESSPDRRALKALRIQDLEIATTIALLLGGPPGKPYRTATCRPHATSSRRPAGPPGRQQVVRCSSAREALGRVGAVARQVR
jgi:DNA-binding transcriptional LysR family regulator